MQGLPLLRQALAKPMAVQAYLAEGVHAAARDDDVVFLDIASDRYTCLPGGAIDLALGPEGEVEIREDGLAHELAAAGLVYAAPSAPRTPIPILPTRSALRDTYPAASLADLPAIGAAVRDVVRDYARRPFAAILATARAEPAPPPAFSAALAAAVDRYHRWAPFAPLPGKCLVRSFVLLKALRREGLDATWVFGVRTWPFHAHCWLQVEEVVLDDHHERVGAYTPLMAL